MADTDSKELLHHVSPVGRQNPADLRLMISACKKEEP